MKLNRFKSIILGAGLMALTSLSLFACSEIEDGVNDIDSWPAPVDDYVPSLEHPGIMHTAKSLNRMKTIVKRGEAGTIESGSLEERAYATYLLMKDYSLSKSNYTMKKTPGVQIELRRGSGGNAGVFQPDFSAACLNSLMWALTGETAHADKAKEILLEYARTVTKIPVHNDDDLLAGLQGFMVAYATELLSHVSYNNVTPLSGDELEEVNGMLRNVFLPVLNNFYATPAFSNGNWGLIVTRAYMAIAILWNDQAMYKQAVDFLLYGNDNGTLKNYIDGDTGQCQESGRDQGHTQLGIGMIASICEMGYQQGNDLYALLDNRLLKGYEYVAGYNLGNEMPFKTWVDVTGKYSNWTKPDSSGTSTRGTFRGIYSIAYNHYFTRKHLSMPYTKQVLDNKSYVEGYDSDNNGFYAFQFCDGDIDPE